MYLAHVTVRTVFSVRRPRIRRVAPLGLTPLQNRHHETRTAGIRSSAWPIGIATVRRPLLTETNLEEVTYTTATEAASIFRPSKPLVDSVDNLDGEIGLKASTKSRAVYEVLRLDKEGHSRRIYVKRRDLLRAHGLKPRDLRCIEPLWDKPQSSHSFVIKNSAFLVSLCGVRCLVSKDRLLLFDPKSTPAKTFLKVVIPCLHTLAGSDQIKSLQSKQNDLEDSCQNTKTAPFEVEVLESIFAVTLSELESELQGLLQQASEVLSIAPAGVKSTDLEQIRETKQEGVELESRAVALTEILEEVLRDEARIQRLNLSHHPNHEHRKKQQEQSQSSLRTNNGVNPYQIDEESSAKLEDEEDEGRGAEELKDLLEYYKQRASVVESEVHRILVRVRDLETSINISLSAKRYEVSRVGLMLSIATATVALSTKVWGILGTNLKLTLEMSSMGFDDFTTFIVISCFHIFALFSNNDIRTII